MGTSIVLNLVDEEADAPAVITVRKMHEKENLFALNVVKMLQFHLYLLHTLSNYYYKKFLV